MAESDNENSPDRELWEIESGDELEEYLHQLEPLNYFTAVNEKTAEQRERMWCSFCE